MTTIVMAEAASGLVRRRQFNTVCLSRVLIKQEVKLIWITRRSSPNKKLGAGNSDKVIKNDQSPKTKTA